MTNEQLERALRIIYDEVKSLKIKVKELEKDLELYRMLDTPKQLKK